MSMRRRPLIFGEVLFDHFPDGSAVLGGAPFNVAWHLHAFGLKPLMITRIGQDALGEKVEQSMQQWGMDCSGLQKDPDHPTGTVQVSIEDGEPSYEIVDQVAYDFIEPEKLPALNDSAKTSWLLYHGSLALRNKTSAATLKQLKQHAVSLFVDINLRPPWWQRDTILAMIEGADWIKLNEDELTELYPESDGQGKRIRALTNLISQQIILTGGEKGATAIPTDGDMTVNITPTPVSDVADTVGAGDAFCSVLLAGQLLDWPLATTMERAQAFASGIVGIRGATSQDESFYRQFTRDWGIKDSDHV